MANVLRMADQKAIEALASHGWSFRRIARELGIHRDTVARYVKRARSAGKADSKAAISTAGSQDSKPAISTAGSPTIEPAQQMARIGRQNLCTPWQSIISSKLEQGLSAQRIWQDLAGEHGFTGSYESVKRFVRRLDAATPLPFRRMECDPGAEAQIDFGKGAPILRADGTRRRTHVFRIVLSHSRKAYSEAVYRQTTEQFMRCIENAFVHFGGAPQVLVIDNLKAAVTKPDWYDPQLHPKLQAFCEHYGVALLPTRPYTPRHKGKIERGIAYVQDNALKARTFATLNDQNRHLLEWEQAVADTRIHGTTRRQVGQLFADTERTALRPLPVERFPFFYEAQRAVHRDGHIEVDHAYYSVPPEHVGARLWVRWDARLVRVFTHEWQLIATHIKQEAGRFTTDPLHLASQKISGVERGTVWLLRKVSLIGPQAERWAQAMLPVRGIQGVRTLQGLLNLGHRHPDMLVERACQTALTHGAFHLEAIRSLIKRDGPTQDQFEFIAEHPIIRSLAGYEALVQASFHKETGT